jgi:hypothetical protein
MLCFLAASVFWCLGDHSSPRGSEELSTTNSIAYLFEDYPPQLIPVVNHESHCRTVGRHNLGVYLPKGFEQRRDRALIPSSDPVLFIQARLPFAPDDEAGPSGGGFYL